MSASPKLGLFGYFGAPVERYNLPLPVHHAPVRSPEQVAAEEARAERGRKSKREKRAALIAVGLCPQCGDRPMAEKRRTCAECAQINLEQDRREHGRAVDAPLPTPASSVPLPKMWGAWEDLGPGPVGAHGQTRRVRCTLCRGPKPTVRTIALTYLRNHQTRRCRRCNERRGRYGPGKPPEDQR